jgi:hypothetical protein
MNMSTTQKKTAMFRTSSRLNRFLQSFILNENPNYSYTVVDPMLPPSEGSKSIFDRLARTPPQMISEGSGGENKSIFHACSRMRHAVFHPGCPPPVPRAKKHETPERD